MAGVLNQKRSFDGGFSCQSETHFPDRYRNLEEIFSRSDRSYSLLGAGLSYTAAGFGSHSDSVSLKDFDRILSFDSQAGEIEVEAGMSLGKLAQFTIPRGWLLAVQPGHPSITVGGCLGADVHGKNHAKDGTFKNQVLSFRLFHPDKGWITADRQTNLSLFDLTCGGYGLSGVVLSIKLRLTAACQKVRMQHHSLASIFELPKVLEELSAKSDLLYSWHDFSSAAKQGRGFVIQGVFEPNIERSINTDPGSEFHFQPLRSIDRGTGLPNVYSNLFIKFLNMGYGHSMKRKIHKVTSENLFESTFPIAKKTIYFDLFGRAGFFEVQLIVPSDRFADFSKAVLAYLQKHSPVVTLGSAKIFKGQANFLRFSGEGICFGVNTPQTESGRKLVEFLNGLASELKLKQNLIKNSTLTSEMVKSGYPDFEAFRTALNQWDSRRRFRSEMSERLAL